MFFVSQVEASFSVLEGLCGFDRCLGSGPGASLRPDPHGGWMEEKGMEKMEVKHHPTFVDFFSDFLT